MQQNDIRDKIIQADLEMHFKLNISRTKDTDHQVPEVCIFSEINRKTQTKYHLAKEAQRPTNYNPVKNQVIVSIIPREEEQ